MEAGTALSERTESVRRAARKRRRVATRRASRRCCGSEDWQGLRYAAATLAYWDAWSRLELSRDACPGAPSGQGARAERGSGLRRSTKSTRSTARGTRTRRRRACSAWAWAQAGPADLEAARTALEHLRARIERGKASEALRVCPCSGRSCSSSCVAGSRARGADRHRASRRRVSPHGRASSCVRSAACSPRAGPRQRALCRCPRSLRAHPGASCSGRRPDLRAAPVRLRHRPARDRRHSREPRGNSTACCRASVGGGRARRGLAALRDRRATPAAAGHGGHRALAASARRQLLKHAPERAGSGQRGCSSRARARRHAGRSRGSRSSSASIPGAPPIPPRSGIASGCARAAGVAAARIARRIPTRRAGWPATSTRRVVSRGEGRLSLDASASATLAVLHARSAYASGATPAK